MSTLLVAIVTVGSTAILCFFLVGIHDKHKRKAMKDLLNNARRLGAENGLNFSSQEILDNCVLGLDGMQRKILVVSKEKSSYSSSIIDLNLVKSCSMKKIYGTIKAGDLKNQKLDRYLEKIVLHFELDHKPPVEIAFYKNVHRPIYETQKLEQKARHWTTILSKMQTLLKNTA